MTLTALHLLATVIPTLRTADFGGLDRLTIDADRARRGLPSRSHTRLLAERCDDLVPGPVVTPLSKVVRGRALGKEIVGEHIPLAATAMEIANRVEDFPPLDRARATSALAGLGGGEQWLHQGPLLVREIGWVPLSGLGCFDHCCALLCSWDMR